MINIPDLNIEQYWDKLATVVLAAWGAWISTLSYLKDKPKVKVNVWDSYLVYPGRARDAQRTVSFDILNTGRRPVIIKKAAIKTDTAQYMLPLQNQYIQYTLPIKLNENEDTSLIIPYKILENSCKENKCNAEYLVITDSSGKRYKAKFTWREWKSLKCNTEKNWFLKIIDKIWFH